MATALPPELAGGMLEVSVAWGADLTDLTGASWVWTDITTDVRQDPGVEVGLGRSDEAATTQPATCTMKLDNTLGRYSLGGRSPNWPYVRRGTPVRVRVKASTAGSYVTLFQGNAAGWSPDWNQRGNVATVTLEAAGTLRRLAQGASPLRSPLRRANDVLTSAVKYWPMEDGDTAQVYSASIGTAGLAYSGSPKIASDSTFTCSGPLTVTTVGTSFQGIVEAYTPGSPVAAQVRFLCGFPKAGTITATSVICRVRTSGGTYPIWELYYAVGGSMGLRAISALGAVAFDSGAYGFTSDGTYRRVSIELVQSGADCAWQIGVYTPYSGAGLGNGTLTTVTVGAVTQVELVPNGDVDQLVLGHLIVQNAQTSLFEASGSINAYRGETPIGGRMTRLCSENGMPFALTTGVNDASTYADAMGDQQITTLLALLRDCEAVAQGVLYDGVSSGLAYTARRAIENQTAVLTVAMTQLDEPFSPVDDDQRTRNQVSASRKDGATVTYRDTAHVAAVGLYDDTITVNAMSDGGMNDLAGWLVSRGTVGGYRFPALTVNLRATPLLAAQVLALYPGARVDLTGLSALTSAAPETVPLIVEGIKHLISDGEWRVTVACSLGQPWGIALATSDSGDLSVFAGRVGPDTSTVSTAAAAGATSLIVATGAGPLWTTTADDYPLDLDVGGVKVTASACSGASSPQTFTITALPAAAIVGEPVGLWQQPALGL